MIKTTTRAFFAGAGIAVLLAVPLTAYANSISSAATGGSSVPSGMIAAFDGPCPSDWSDYGPATGRSLIGDGAFSQSYRGQNYSINYSLGQTGGVRAYRLAGSEIPNNKNGGVAGENCDYAGCAYSGVPTSAKSHTGYGGAFDNQDPYIVVNYCRKN